MNRTDLRFDNRPIGVFDSGLGGLTSVKELMRALPWEKIVYLGDTGRVPYGTRSRETILKYTLQDITFLEQHNVKVIVVACGTITTVALDHIDKSAYCPLFGVADPAVNAALAATRSGRVGVLGTPATIASGAYQAKLLARRPGLFVLGKACPMFVPLVENGYVSPDNAVLRLMVEEYLTPVLESRVDTIILGCTHYPLLRGAIADFCPGVTLIDPGYETAKRVAEYLDAQGMASAETAPKARFYVTDSTENFINLGSMFLEQAISGQVERIELA